VQLDCRVGVDLGREAGGQAAVAQAEPGERVGTGVDELSTQDSAAECLSQLNSGY
jgi:hypothetical protein